MYFERVYRDENAIVIEDNGRVLSSLQLIPYTMMFCGEEISVAYISGACTLPSEQGKGLMRKLLEEAFEEMRRRGVDLTALIPAEKWLFDYYRSQGYTEVFEYSRKVYTRHEYIEPERDLFVVPHDDKPTELLYAYFDRKLRERPACMLHSYDDFGTILKDLKISKGRLFVVYNPDKQPVGMAFAYPPEKSNTPESAFIKEVLYDNERVKKHLFFEITRYYKVIKAVYRIPFKDSLMTYSYGMAQVIDKEKLIKIWLSAHPDTETTIAQLQKMDIRMLTAYLFDFPNKKAYMSLMLD